MLEILAGSAGTLVSSSTWFNRGNSGEEEGGNTSSTINSITCCYVPARSNYEILQIQSRNGKILSINRFIHLLKHKTEELSLIGKSYFTEDFVFFLLGYI